MQMGFKYNYFDTLIVLFEHSCNTPQILIDCLVYYNPKKLRNKLEEVERLVSESDRYKLILMDNLAKEFITPIGKEDIIEIAQKIINVTYAIDDGFSRIYMYDLVLIRNDSLLLAQ